MSSTFVGVAIANRGLTSSQNGLSVTTNNISNVNTTGYSRQTVNQIAIGPAAVYNNSYIGSGSEVTSVTRTSSFRLNQKYWQENSSLSEYDEKSSCLTEIEDVLGTSSTTTDFSTTMDSFYSALSSLSTDPSSSSARAVVQEDGQAVCSYLNDASSRLSQLRDSVNTDVKTNVDQINSYASQIADLNQQITVAASANASTNDLEDSRDLLIDKLSSLADVSVTATTINTQADGSTTSSYSVSIGGATLVSGNTARQLECYTITGSSDNNNGMYGIRWTDTGDAFDPGTTGSLKADLDLRDGSGTAGESKGIPYYTSQLDEFAQTFAEAFNEGIYKDGSSYYSGIASGYGSDGSTGIRFFSYDSLSSSDLMASGTTTAAVYANITAANISLSSDVVDDTAKIATASSANETSNNDVVNDLISICKDSRMFDSGSPEDFYNSIISTLGAETAYATRQDNIQSAMVSYVSDQRSSVSGVSTNEETANLTKYQQAYAASASAITTWKTVLQDTINMVSS